MSSIGLPMLNGFVGEFLILLGAFLTHPWYAVVAASGVVLAAAYMLWMFRRVMFGPVDNPENRKLIDLDLREKIVLVAITIPIVWIGVNPDPLLRRVEPSVSALLQDVHARAAHAEPAPAAPSAVALAGAEVRP
jgi:NADH-quinone oxidoreductase subunit M